MYLLACNICAYVVSLEIELHIIQICLYVVIVIKLSYTYACIDQLRVTFNQERLFTYISLHFLSMQNYWIPNSQTLIAINEKQTIIIHNHSFLVDQNVFHCKSLKKWSFHFDIYKNICALKTSIRFEFHHTCSTRKGYARQIIVNIGGNIMLIQFE